MQAHELNQPRQGFCCFNCFLYCKLCSAAICAGWLRTSGVGPALMVRVNPGGPALPRAARRAGEGQLSLDPGASQPEEGRRIAQPAVHPLCPGHPSANCAFLWRAERRREGGSCVNPRCVLGLLGFCLSNASGLCCLQTLFAATAIAALCLVRTTVLRLRLPCGGSQDPVACKGKRFSNLIFPCHLERATERIWDAIPKPCLDANCAFAFGRGGLRKGTAPAAPMNSSVAGKPQTSDPLGIVSRRVATSEILAVGFACSN